MEGNSQDGNQDKCEEDLQQMEEGSSLTSALQLGVAQERSPSLTPATSGRGERQEDAGSYLEAKVETVINANVRPPSSTTEESPSSEDLPVNANGNGNGNGNVTVKNGKGNNKIDPDVELAVAKQLEKCCPVFPLIITDDADLKPAARRNTQHLSESFRQRQYAQRLKVWRTNSNETKSTIRDGEQDDALFRMAANNNKRATMGGEEGNTTTGAEGMEDEGEQDALFRMIATKRAAMGEADDTIMTGADGMEENENDDALFMMIAKKRAAIGEDDTFDTDIIGGSGDYANVTKDDFVKASQAPTLRRGRQMNDAHELQRPGAYSKSPGDTFKRCRTFERETFVTTRAGTPSSDTNENDNPQPSGRPQSTSPTASPSRPPRRGRRKPAPRTLAEEEPDDFDEDGKPAATQRFSSYNTLSSSDSSPPRSSFRPTSLARIERSSLAMGEDTPHRPSSRRSRPYQQSSLRLSALARRSFCNTSTDSSESDWTEKSDKMIADLAEQSVSNFVKSFANLSSMDALPVAATVVPSEEDLEGLIRSRLESELQKHLSRELHHFRQNLFQEIVRRGQMQVAECIEGGGEYDNNNNDNGNHPRDHHRGPFLDTYPDQEEDTTDASHSDHDHFMPLESVPEAASIRPRREDFSKSIRQSIRKEFGNLSEECCIEEAQVISSDRPRLETPTWSLSLDEVSNSGSFTGNHQIKIGSVDEMQEGKQYVFSSQSLLASAFAIFLVGAFVGAGISILVMASIRED